MLSANTSSLEVCLELTNAISRSNQLEPIYSAALDALAAGLGTTRSAILLFDPDGVMRFKAWRGLSQDYRAAVEGHTPWRRGQTGVAPIVVEDVLNDAALSVFRSAFAAECIGALTFVPLVGHSGVIGKFMLYSTDPWVPSLEELQLAEIIAAQIAFAVERTTAYLSVTTSEQQVRRALADAYRLAAIVDSTDDAIVGKDLNGIVTSWNGAAERMFGYTAAEAIGRSITLIIPAERLSEEDLVLSHVRAGEPVSMETVRQRKDGSTLDIALTVSPIRGDDGTIIGVSKIARDISRRKADEAQLADLQLRLMRLLGASASLLDSPEAAAVENRTIAIARDLLVADGYAVWRRDAEAGWTMVSSDGVSDAFALRHVESSAAPDIPEPMAMPDVMSVPSLAPYRDAYVAEGIRSALVCPLRSNAELSGTLVFYYRSPRDFSDVEIRTAQAFANLAASAITTAHLYADQQRQRKAAELASVQSTFLSDAAAVLAQSLDYEKTLRTIAQMAVPQIADWCAVDVLNDEGRLERLAVAHIDPERLKLAQQLDEQYPPDPDAQGGVHAVMRSGKPAMLSTITPEVLDRAARNDAHRQLLRSLALSSYMCVPLTAAGRTIGALTFLFAESGRRYSERDLSFATDVATRASLAIANAHAYRRVREANQMKDAFIATLSHELRTPLNAILGYAQMLGMGLLEGERHARALAVLTRNAESLKQIIDDVLDVSRMTSGKLHLAMDVADLRNVIANASATVQPAADAKGVTLSSAVNDDVPQVFADQDRLQQVLWNLLSNAVKFTPRGGHVEVQVALAADHRVAIVVRDTGQGIDAAFLPHVFERFRQADSRFSRQHGGLGLGLSIVRELVELHGGEVDAASEGPGTGATFTVRLPLMPSPHAHAEEHAAVARPSAGTSDRLSHRLDGVRVLAVDDEEDALGLLRVILEAAGAKVTTVVSAAEALAALQRDAFDTLIADIGMPDGDGLELIRAIRQTLPAPENRIPAAALTAYARSEDRVAALASGFQMHIAKPVNPAELIIALSALIGRN